MNPLVDKVLSTDPIAVVEKMIGKDNPSEFTDDENKLMFMMGMAYGEIKKDLLSSVGDTSYYTTWDEFLVILNSQGFKKAYQYYFPYRNLGLPTESCIIYYNPKNGFVVFACSFGDRKTINEAKIYGQVKRIVSIDDVPYYPDGDSYYFESDKLALGKDAREGLINTISKWDNEYFEPIPIWEHKPSIWFVDYVECDTKGFDYKRATQEKLQKCCPEAQAIMAVCIEENQA